MIIKEGTDASAVTPEQIEELASAIEIFRRAAKLTKKQIAEAVGYGQATITEFIAGKYKGDAGKVALSLQHWLIEAEERASRPETTEFTWTNVALQIKSVANYCRDKRTIGLVYGGDSAGIGKTTSLRAIHQLLGPKLSSLCTIDKVDANPSGLLRKLSNAMHMDCNGTNKARFDRLVGALRGRSHLFLIDQIHNLRFAKDDKPFYILTDLYDATKAAQLWCGTTDMVAYLERQRKRNADESLAQIRRRIFPCVNLMDMLSSGGEDGKGEPLVSIDQVLEMFARNKLRLTRAAAQFICSLINTPDTGGVGFAVNIVEYATSLLEHTGIKSLDVGALKQAMRNGITDTRAQLIMHDVEEHTLRIAKVG